jgi:hypothetical protein
MGVPLPIHLLILSVLQIVSNVSERILFTELPLLTVEDHFGKTTNTDVYGCTNPRQQATTFCVVVHNVNGSLVWNLLLDTLLAPRILGWILHLGLFVDPC